MPETQGTALMVPTLEERLRHRIAGLERELNLVREDRDYWRRVWVGVCESRQELAERNRELTAVLSRLQLRMTP